MKTFTFVVITLLLVGCGQTPIATPTESLPAPSTDTVVVVTPVSVPSFDAEVYRDELGRFEITYPVGWMVDASQAGSRGSIVQITSWQHPEGGITEIPADGSILGITVYQWDPKSDLAARIAMRRTNFLDSGNLILEENEISYPGGPAGLRLLLQTTDGQQSLITLLQLGDDYLELSGSGDIPLLEEILSTFRYTN
jgi:hypothetical protein